MDKFNDSVDGSFDDILATMDVPSTKASSTQAKIVSPVKKPRLSFETDDAADSMLANVVMPEATTSTQANGKPVNAPPISAGKTNCVLVNPKQRGNCTVVR